MKTETAETLPPAAGSSGLFRNITKKLLNAGLIIFLFVTIAFFAIASPHFLAFNNFMNILLSVSIIGITAPAMTVVVVAKGLDLSVGSTMALAGSMETLVAVTYGLPWWAGLLSGLLVGLLVGVVNSLLITRVKISPIITTLGTMGIVRGTAFVITNGQSIFIQSPPLEWIGLGRVLGIPVPVIIMIAIFFLFWWVCRFTVFGRYIYSIGGNAVASRLAGIRVNRVVDILYIVTGGLSALSGMVIVGFSATSLPSAGAGYELDIITAVLLGGASLEGGEGSVWRTLLGVVIIGIINNGMALLNVPPYWQILSKGALLLLAVAADKLKK